jgi:predicted DCC family thiol-disulfide oxidoreductase YuxK
VNIAWPLRIYYDRRCPLCERELRALFDNDVQGHLLLVDCSPPDFHDAALEQAGITPQQAMTLIQACDAQGHWIHSVAVFEAAYAAVGLDRMARMWAHPLLRPVWDAVYPWVARHRMRLSALGLDRPFGWLVRRSAQRAAVKARACSAGSCALPPSAHGG